MFFWDDASYILISHLVASATCLFLLWVSKHSSTAISTFVPLQHILLNKNVYLQNVLFLTFLSKVINN